jgi:tRNA dimethylallyltransferase
MSSPRLLLITGPTSAGKTAVAIRIARTFDAPVISADAMQVYRGMDIGTGKAREDDLGEVVHYGIDIRNPDESFDAADFLALCEEVMAQHPRVIVAGGTSLYLRSLIRGLVETPPVDPVLRQELEGVADLHGMLNAVDPVLAQGLHPNDRVRLIRGVEVYRTTGQRLSDLHREHAQMPDRVNATGIWLDRTDVFERIDRRVLEMVREGYLEEVQALLSRGYPRDLKPMMSLGYRHMTAHLLDGLSLEEAIRLTQRDTRRYARKQRNWRKSLGYPGIGPEDVDAIDRAAQEAFMG